MLLWIVIILLILTVTFAVLSKYKKIRQIKLYKWYRSSVILGVVTGILFMILGFMGGNAISIYTAANPNSCPPSYPNSSTIVVLGITSVLGFIFADILAFKSHQIKIGILTLILAIIAVFLAYVAFFAATFCFTF